MSYSKSTAFRICILIKGTFLSLGRINSAYQSYYLLSARRGDIWFGMHIMWRSSLGPADLHVQIDSEWFILKILFHFNGSFFFQLKKINGP